MQNTKISQLMDIYGCLLTPHQLELLKLYYDCDVSLTELSEQFDISRQAARDAIQRGEKLLMQFEDKLAILSERDERQKRLSTLLDLLTTAEKANSGDENLCKAILLIEESIRNLEE